jgi:DNA-binding NtrC family response regulator
MVEVLSMVERIADSRIPVWIFGESGTGKEAIANALHLNGPRAKKPFVTENCGALPESLLESELFGHKKGAFTHATADRKGILQYADGGTIFLDEIADMSVGLQAKLLRFLQEGEIRPIGSLETIRADVRVVSASNKDLSRLVAEGKFREDLYYRLNGVTVKLPPLRDRMEDLTLLAEHFLKRIAEREKKPVCHLAAPALNLFLNYRWPGNIRELQNTLETAALFAEDGTIGLKALHFKPDLLAVPAARPAQALGTATKPAPAGGMDPVLEETLRAIKDNGYHKGHASEALGISRRALYGRLQKFGLATDVKTLKGMIDRSFGS